jgi:hypothetical protein
MLKIFTIPIILLNHCVYYKNIVPLKKIEGTKKYEPLI